MNTPIAIDRDSWRSDRDTWRRICAIVAMSVSSRGPDPLAVSVDDSLDIAATLRGDQEAFSRLIERYQIAIAQQMRRFSRQPAVVEELVHDVFVEAFVSLKSYRSSAPLLHWLRKIAVRTGYRFWTRNRREHSRVVPLSRITEELELQTAGADTAPSDASQRLGELLEHLAPRDRLVLTLLYWDGCSVSEAASLAGWSETMLKVQAHRARNRLKKLIEETER